jgi:hypothetical protein
MSKENFYKYLIIGLIFLGSILRLTIFWVSPVNNSFDDHLEVIKIYSEKLSRPLPFQCWECYQPPLYYYIAAKVLYVTKSLGLNNYACWKMVQLINPLLSIILLFVVYQILILLNSSKLIISVILSFIISLPRDIMTASMIGNDYMLVFFTILSFYCFLKILISYKSGLSVRFYLFLMFIFVTLGCLTKQHGFLLYIFPFFTFFFFYKKRLYDKFLWLIPFLLASLFISLSDELWRYNTTGVFLVSNQNYFDFAKNQFPGSLDKVEFFSFRFFELFKEPFLSNKTGSSFLTELFARTFYDYEWRFISPKIPFYSILGIISYTVGFMWLVYFFSILYFFSRKILFIYNNLDFVTLISIISPVVLAILFMFVPLIQTIRFPYYSSMKAMFMLSGIILLIIIVGSKIQQSALLQKIGLFFIVLNICFSTLFVFSIAFYIHDSLNHLSGPLWQIP